MDAGDRSRRRRARKRGRPGRSITPDPSCGYEAVAHAFIHAREHSTVGAAEVREWAATLPLGAVVVDLGCGTGVPISEVLVAGGFRVFGIDASPSILAAFRARFPDVPAQCAAVESSDFFNRTFDAAVAWGLVFLLEDADQRALIRKVADVVREGGAFLFTAPARRCTWRDAMTGQRSTSLGRKAYREILEAQGFTLAAERDDEGANHYYYAVRRIAARPYVGRTQDAYF